MNTELHGLFGIFGIISPSFQFSILQINVKLKIETRTTNPKYTSKLCNCYNLFTLDEESESEDEGPDSKNLFSTLKKKG